MEDLDEDVIFEGDQLHQYLKDIGFKEFDVIQRGASSNCLHENRQKPPDNSMDSRVLLEHVDVILRSGLLFEEDANVLKSMIPAQEGGGGDDDDDDQPPAEPVWIRPFFTDAMKYSVGSLSWCCYNMWGSAVLPMTAISSVILFTFWDWTKNYKSKKRLSEQKSLSGALQKLFFILKKSLKYIQENELVLRGFMLAKTGSAVSRLESSRLPCMAKRWQSMPGLRKGIVCAILAGASALKRATLDLLIHCPLNGQLDNTGHYLACLDQETLGLPPIDNFGNEEELTVQELKRLHHIYLLLQSEFLRRLGLCFLPRLWKEDNFGQIESVMKSVHFLTDVCLTVASNLTREYNVFYSYGVGDGAQKKRPLPISEHKHFAYADTYVAVHSAGLHLQAMLLRIRGMEQSLESEIELESPAITKDLLSKMEDIMQELDLCKSCCDECVSQLSKMETSSKIIEKQPHIDSAKAACNSAASISEPVLVGYTDLDPKVEDEVYEAEIYNENDDRNVDHDYFDYVKISKEDREREKQLSKRMLQELKSVLVDRAQEWKEREAKALENKQGRYEAFHMKSGKILNSDTPPKYNQIKKGSENCIEVGSSSIICLNSHNPASLCTCLTHNVSPDSGNSLRTTFNPVQLSNDDCQHSKKTPSTVTSVQNIRNDTSVREQVRTTGTESPLLENNLPQMMLGSVLSLDAVERFRSNENASLTETFVSMGDKSDSEESLCSP
ncbi:vezatin isoform X2 [Anabrus simplex]|uniref:vezatin isoform X2 n=1 Tax=Anabrus simplex TaxID=316456 RepID=UPI0035A31440